MRSLALLIVLVGCSTGGDVWDPCDSNPDCNDGLVCARDGLCERASQVREVLVTWTVRGQAASTASCVAHPDLELRFYGDYGTELGYAPVPCFVGRFLVDKLPQHYRLAELGVFDGDEELRTIPTSNVVEFVLN